MPKTKTRTLKILVDTKHLSPMDINSIEQWENEGGAAGETPSFMKSLAPLKHGQIFEVLGGEISYEDEKVYFTAEIDLLALP